MNKKLQELEQKIQQMKAEGNREGEAALRTQKAMMLVLDKNVTAATKELARIGMLAEHAGEYDSLAKTTLAQAKIFRADPAQQKKAKKLFDDAAAIYHTLEDHTREAEALQELANISIEQGENDRALKYLDRATAALEQTDAWAALVEIYEIRSTVLMLKGDLEGGIASLEKALALAKEHQDKNVMLRVRLAMQTIRGMSAQDINVEEITNILAEAEALGNLEVAGDIRMQQAAESFKDKDFETAYTHALAARDAARDSADLQKYNRYLMSTIMMAGIKEEQGDRPGVISALLTCKVYLGTHLGAQVGQQINLVLDSLKTRWGAEGVAEAVKAYQEQAKENPPKP